MPKVMMKLFYRRWHFLWMVLLCFFLCSISFSHVEIVNGTNYGNDLRAMQNWLKYKIHGILYNLLWKGTRYKQHKGTRYKQHKGTRYKQHKCIYKVQTAQRYKVQTAQRYKVQTAQIYKVQTAQRTN